MGSQSLGWAGSSQGCFPHMSGTGLRGLHQWRLEQVGLPGGRKQAGTLHVHTAALVIAFPPTREYMPAPGTHITSVSPTVPRCLGLPEPLSRERSGRSHITLTQPQKSGSITSATFHPLEVSHQGWPVVKGLEIRLHLSLGRASKNLTT